MSIAPGKWLRDRLAELGGPAPILAEKQNKSAYLAPVSQSIWARQRSNLAQIYFPPAPALACSPTLSQFILLHHVRRRWLVFQRLHRAPGAALAQAAHGTGIAEQLAQGGIRLDGGHAAAVLGLDDDGPP